MRTTTKHPVVRRARVALLAVGALVVGSSCDENLPSGPNTFSASLQIVIPHDTLVVGDSSIALAKATDANGHQIQALTYVWGSADSTIVNFATAGSDAAASATRTLIGRKTGRSSVTLKVPDSRFVVPGATRNETVVVGGVRVLSTHDSTLTAVNDTGVAIAAGLVRVSGALVPKASQGIRWTHLGLHATVVGQGDTIRYVARSNGADTLIASHDFCLAGAKCADTAIVRVSQQLNLTLSTHNLAAWSFGDSLGPTVTLSDRRGNGLAGTTVRFVPAAAADSAIVKVTGPIGTSNPVTGLTAARQLVATANGTAHVTVLGIAPDGFSVLATDALTEVVRQVARRVQVEPLRALSTFRDSIPVRALARDARGAPIADALVTTSASGITLNGIWAGPTPPSISTVIGSITPTLTGSTLPQNNPGAPQVPVAVDVSLIALGTLDTVTAGATQTTVSILALDSLAQPAFGKWVRFGANFGPVPDSARVDVDGLVSAVWTPPDSAGSYTLTGLRGTTAPMTTVTDSAGRILYRRTVIVKADIPSPLKSTAAISATNIAINGTALVTVTVKDKFGNVVKNALPTDVTLTSGAGGGTFSAVTCSQGICTATYTAPAVAGPDAVNVKVSGVAIAAGPIVLVIF